MRNHKAAGNAGCRTVFDEHSGADGHSLPRDVSCGEIRVILELSADDEFVVVGSLAERDSNYIAFDYVVLDGTLEDRLHATGIVLLKRDCDPMASLEQIPCAIVSDSDDSDASFFGLHVRRCVLRRTGQ